MANKESTCGNCPHLNRMDVFAGCAKTGFVVPHEYASGKYTFWRIPMSCPRDVSDVVKSEKTAPKREWVKKLIKDVREVTNAP